MTYPKHPWAVVFVVLFANFTYYASFAVLNSVLTDIATELNTSESSVLWVTTLPPLLGAALTPSFGSLSDQFGRKRVWVIGYILNFLALGLAGISESLAVLLVARALCGIGSAMENPTGSAIILSSFPESRHGLLLGLMSTVATFANSLGLLVGGVVTEYYGWRWLFKGPFIPVGLALGLAIAVLPKDPPPPASTTRQALREFDWAGTAVFSMMMSLMLVGINRGGAASFAEWPVILCLAVAAMMFPLLIRVEMKATHAILPPALMTSLPVALTLAYSCFRDITYMILFIIFPLYLRDYCQLTAGAVSLLTFMRPLASGVLGPLSGRMADSPKYPTHVIMLWSAIASVSDKVTGLLSMWYGVVDRGMIISFQALQGGVAGVNGTATRLFVTSRTTAEHLGNVQGILSMFNFASQTIGMDIGIAFLATTSDSRGKGTLPGYRNACITSLVAYCVSLVMPAWLSYQQTVAKPINKVSIPPLYVRRDIALHSMIMATKDGTEIPLTSTPDIDDGIEVDDGESFRSTSTSEML